MEIIKVIGTIISFVIMMLGVIMIYDARKLTKKWFSFHEQNESTKWSKIIGFILFVIGMILLFFVI